MRKIGLILCALCYVMTLSCQRKEGGDNWPPYTALYAPMVAFVDEEGMDMTESIEMEEYEGRYAGPDQYRFIKETPVLRCFVNGVEYKDGDIVPPLNRPTILSVDAIKLDDGYKYIRLIFEYWMGLEEFVKAEPHEFEFRFQIPSISGNKEHSLKITSVPLSFNDAQKTDCQDSYFNGMRIQKYKPERGKRTYIATPVYLMNQ